MKRKIEYASGTRAVLQVQNTVRSIMAVERKCDKCGNYGRPFGVHVRNVNGTECYSACCQSCYRHSIVTRAERTNAVRLTTVKEMNERIKQIGSVPK
jgi:hypothetical protein